MNGRIVDLRQRRYGRLALGHRAREHDRGHLLRAFADRMCNLLYFGIGWVENGLRAGDLGAPSEARQAKARLEKFRRLVNHRAGGNRQWQ